MALERAMIRWKRMPLAEQGQPSRRVTAVLGRSCAGISEEEGPVASGVFPIPRGALIDDALHALGIVTRKFLLGRVPADGPALPDGQMAQVQGRCQTMADLRGVDQMSAPVGE